MGNTALHQVFQIDRIETFLQHGIDPNIANNEGNKKKQKIQAKLNNLDSTVLINVFYCLNLLMLKQ